MFGHSGMLHALNETPNKEVFSDGVGSSQVPMYYSFPSRHADGYNRELDHFLDVVQNNVTMSVTDRMTSAVSKGLRQLKKNAELGKTHIK